MDELVKEITAVEFFWLRDRFGLAGYEPPTGASTPLEAEALTVQSWRAKGCSNKMADGWKGEHWAYLLVGGALVLSPVNVGGE